MTGTPDIEITSIVTSGGTQSRAELSEQAVADYAEVIASGSQFKDPIVVFHDGSTYWLADGFHRVMAANRAGVEWLGADVRKGTKRDAILHSVGANSAHGLQRTNADKRRAVTMLLQDEEWVTWSNCEIGRRCCVDESTVRRIKDEISLRFSRSDPAQPRNYTNKHGTQSTMKTDKIGRGHTGTREAKIATIRELAAQGFRATQIATKVDLDAKTVRVYANKEGIVLADKAIGKAHLLDSRRVIEQTVVGLDAAANSLQIIPFSFDGIEPSEAAEWAESVAESLSIFRAFHKQLKEASNG